MRQLVVGADAPYWFQAVTIALNVCQTVALAYVYSRWRRVDGALAVLQHQADLEHAPYSPRGSAGRA